MVLLSGGQDSTTCLFWAKQHFETVVAVGFDYGQKHKAELEAAEAIVRRAGVPYQIYNVRQLLAASSLTHAGAHNASSAIDHTLPNSFVAGRNLLFLSIAGSRAAEQGINDIVAGVCQTDYSGYPDCRRATIDAMQLSLSLGLGIGDVRIHTPLMYLTKAETWRLAQTLGIVDIIINDTITDYNGDATPNDWGKGQLDNPASILRQKGYEEAKTKGWI
jgi:7-cyano-7-deazaguanine synthase